MCSILLTGNQFYEEQILVSLPLSQLPGVLENLEQPEKPLQPHEMGGQSPYLGGTAHPVTQMRDVWEPGSAMAPWELAL